MFYRKGRLARVDCPHTSTVTVRHGGIERRICETCGHVSLRPLEELSGQVDRSQFERQVERAR